MPRARKSFGPADGARADPPNDSTASETLETFKAQDNGLFKRGKYVQAKAVHRAAHIKLQEYKKALICFTSAAQQSPADATVKAGLEAANELLRQSKGRFNPQQLYFGSQRPQQIEYAIYTGPLTVKLIAGDMSPQNLSVDADKIARLVKYNAFGEGKSHNATPMDPLVVARHETDARYCMCALYPLLSMANHSCCPNSQYMFINDVAFVRAGKDLKEGEEVTISYQAHQLQTHVKERQKATQNWGFHCQCLRCQAEMSIPASVNKTLQTLRANLTSSPCAPGSVLASYRAANKSGSTRDYTKVVQRLQLLLKELDAALAETVLSDQQIAWMRFTVLSAYECCRTCYEHLQDLQALHQVWRTILLLHESTSPASDYHVREAVTAVFSLGATCGGTNKHLVRNAIKQAEAVMTLRYGPMSDAQMQQAVQQVSDRTSNFQQQQ